MHTAIAPALQGGAMAVVIRKTLAIRDVGGFAQSALNHICQAVFGARFFEKLNQQGIEHLGILSDQQYSSFMPLTTSVLPQNPDSSSLTPLRLRLGERRISTKPRP